MYKFFRNIYIALKKIPIIGSLLKVCRDIFSKIYNSKSSLHKRDVKSVRNILDQIYPDDKDAQKYLTDFLNSESFKQEFSFGRSGDYSVMLLYVITRMSQPEVFVETGVASGRSSAAILQAMADNNKGKLYSIDLPQFYGSNVPESYTTHEGNSELKGFIPEGEEGPGWLVPQNLRARWSLILGDSKVELPKLMDSLSGIDIFYHDSDHGYESMIFEFNTSWPKIKNTGFLFSDDVKWNDSFKDFVAKEDCQNVYRYRGIGIIKK